MSKYVLLVFPLSVHEREASVDRSRVLHSSRENSVSSSSQFREHGETRSKGEYAESRGVVFKKKSSQEAFSDIRFFFRTSTGSGQQRNSIQILQPGKFDEIIL